MGGYFLEYISASRSLVVTARLPGNHMSISQNVKLLLLTEEFQFQYLLLHEFEYAHTDKRYYITVIISYHGVLCIICIWLVNGGNLS